MPGTTTSQTIGQQLAHSSAIDEAIDAIVAQVESHSAKITDARPALDGAKAEYEELLSRAAAVKGRGLLYPMLGSGAGNGPLVELADGSVKWDMICGIGVHFFGHAHPELVRASLKAGTQDAVKHGNLQSNFEAYRFAETLVSLAKRNSRLSQCFVTTSGAVANESALKVCYQKHAPASRVIAFKDCFMGRTVTMAQIGDSAAGRDGVPLSTQVDYMPFWTEAEVARAGGESKFIDYACARLQEYITRYPKQHACFIFELVQGEGGFNTAPREFFTALMDICRANDIAIWDDEIQSFGRTHEMFAYETMDLGDYIDVFCVGKMTQACATLYTDEYAPRAGLLSGTFTGSSQDFAAGTRILEMLRDGDLYGSGGALETHHRLFVEQVDALAKKHPAWFPAVPGQASLTGGMGGMMRFTPFGGDKSKVIAACKACFDEGVVLFWCGHGPYHVRMLPPVPVMKTEYWPRIFEVVERGLARAAG
ncbi:MAG TPA: aminotransferase class III-fold pyridoxal phosphate-dependent enzyme [Phycisphaerales bacterium]|nr:aminotransferase class III-fold pyridoxal phosphate-dependent enzyme [Phycisphaerales bacterium]